MGRNDYFSSDGDVKDALLLMVWRKGHKAIDTSSLPIASSRDSLPSKLRVVCKNFVIVIKLDMFDTLAVNHPHQVYPIKSRLCCDRELMWPNYSRRWIWSKPPNCTCFVNIVRSFELDKFRLVSVSQISQYLTNWSVHLHHTTMHPHTHTRNEQQWCRARHWKLPPPHLPKTNLQKDPKYHICNYSVSVYVLCTHEMQVWSNSNEMRFITALLQMQSLHY